MKKCSCCKERRPLVDFVKDKSRGDGLGYTCKICRSLYRQAAKPTKLAKEKAWYEEKETPEQRERRRKTVYAWKMRNRYGLTLEQIDDMLATQGGYCFGCDRPFTGRVKPYVDHDHLTGQVRGLLCRECNTALGMVHDNLETLERLAVYLNLHAGKKAA